MNDVTCGHYVLDTRNVTNEEVSLGIDAQGLTDKPIALQFHMHDLTNCRAGRAVLPLKGLWFLAPLRHALPEGSRERRR